MNQNAMTTDAYYRKLPFGMVERKTPLYNELASWWPLLSPPMHYAGEAANYVQMLREHAN